MRRVVVLGAAALVCRLAPSAAAADFDGTQSIICAPANIVSCSPEGDCDHETADSVNLPRFLKFDFAQKRITGTRLNGDALATTIGEMHHVPDSLVLQGTEGNFMWSVLIGEARGDMTLTVGGDQIGFVAFGACTPG